MRYENLIDIDLKRDELLDEYAKTLLRQFYMLASEDSPQQALARASVAYCEGDYALAQRMYDYTSHHHVMFSSPVLSNAPMVGQAPVALPISCYLQYVPNSLNGLIDHSNEERWLTVKGGGIGAHWSDVQAVGSRIGKGGTHPGLMGFLHTHDADMLAYRQGSTRRGSYKAGLHVSHPEVLQFINMRRAVGGDSNKKNLNLHHAVHIDDNFKQAVAQDREWLLIDPETRQVMDSIKARVLWQEILQTRAETGEPFIIDVDEANRRMNPYQKEKGLHINGTNLCTEIYLPTNDQRTAVCCLMSLNLEKYDEWKDTQIVEDCIRFLDNVLTFFIRHAPPALKKAVASATAERSVGLGTMGFHSYLQMKGIPWESAIALSINRNIYKRIYEKGNAESYRLGAERGEPSDLVGTGKRNAHLFAIAPNANNSIILGVSPSIEPEVGVAYVRDTRAGTGIYKNKHFANLLRTKYPEFDIESTWKRVAANDGSVQVLEFLSDDDKRVFKTAYELDQHWVVRMARARQEYVDQGQSVNLFFLKGSSRGYLHTVHWAAFDPTGEFQPLKALYYYRSEQERKADDVSIQKVRASQKNNNEECVSCQG